MIWHSAYGVTSGCGQRSRAFWENPGSRGWVKLISILTRWALTYIVLYIVWSFMDDTSGELLFLVRIIPTPQS